MRLARLLPLALLSRRGRRRLHDASAGWTYAPGAVGDPGRQRSAAVQPSAEPDRATRTS